MTELEIYSTEGTQLFPTGHHRTDEKYVSFFHTKFLEIDNRSEQPTFNCVTDFEISETTEQVVLHYQGENKITLIADLREEMKNQLPSSWGNYDDIDTKNKLFSGILSSSGPDSVKYESDIDNRLNQNKNVCLHVRDAETAVNYVLKYMKEDILISVSEKETKIEDSDLGIVIDTTLQKPVDLKARSQAGSSEHSVEGPTDQPIYPGLNEVGESSASDNTPDLLTEDSQQIISGLEGLSEKLTEKQISKSLNTEIFPEADLNLEVSMTSESDRQSVRDDSLAPPQGNNWPSLPTNWLPSLSALLFQAIGIILGITLLEYILVAKEAVTGAAFLVINDLSRGVVSGTTLGVTFGFMIVLGAIVLFLIHLYSEYASEYQLRNRKEWSRETTKYEIYAMLVLVFVLIGSTIAFMLDGYGNTVNVILGIESTITVISTVAIVLNRFEGIDYGSTDIREQFSTVEINSIPIDSIAWFIGVLGGYLFGVAAYYGSSTRYPIVLWQWVNTNIISIFVIIILILLFGGIVTYITGRDSFLLIVVGIIVGALMKTLTWAPSPFSSFHLMVATGLIATGVSLFLIYQNETSPEISIIAPDSNDLKKVNQEFPVIIKCTVDTDMINVKLISGEKIEQQMKCGSEKNNNHYQVYLSASNTGRYKIAASVGSEASVISDSIEIQVVGDDSKQKSGKNGVDWDELYRD